MTKLPAEPATLRLPPTVLFGPGCVRELPRLLAGFGARAPLVVTDPGVAATGLPARIAGELSDAGLRAAVWDGCRPDPHDGIPELCRDAAVEGEHDLLVAVGGGSVIDAAKIAALLAAHGGSTGDYYGLERADGAGGPGVPLVAVPTTSGGGSEVSAHAVVLGRAAGRKEVVAGEPLIPRAAVVDPETMLTLPAPVTLHAALDGLVHALEGFTARKATPFTDAFVREALPRIVRALPRVLAAPDDLAAREELALGGLFSGFAMAGASAGAAHALGYPLSTRYGLAHGLANALVAPAVLERLAPERPERYAELVRLWEASGVSAPGGEGQGSLPELFRRWLAGLGVEPGLASYGVPEADLAALAREASGFRPVLANTPAALGVDDLAALYRRAWPAGSAGSAALDLESGRSP